jgi:uncharacterized protein (TIGR04255 family)
MIALNNQKTMYPTLRIPPLKEAILEVMIDTEDKNTMPLVEQFKDLINNQFPKQQPIVRFKAQFDLSNKSESQFSETSSHGGYRMLSEDEKSILIVNENTLTMSAVNMSYTSWDNFFPERFSLLNTFLDLFKPNKISRVSLRFINEISFKEQEDTSGFKSLINIPDTWEFPLTGSLTQVTLEKAEQNLTGSIREIIQPGDTDLTIFVDIDTQAHDAKSINDDLLKTFLNLRDFKNEIFFTIVSGELLKKFQ